MYVTNEYHLRLEYPYNRLSVVPYTPSTPWLCIREPVQIDVCAIDFCKSKCRTSLINGLVFFDYDVYKYALRELSPDIERCGSRHSAVSACFSFQGRASAPQVLNVSCEKAENDQPSSPRVHQF